MKLQDLLEMPKYSDKEAPFTGNLTRFYSDDTIKADFEFIERGKDSLGSDFYVIIRKNKSLAAIGVPAVRDGDKKSGMKIIGIAEFKGKPDVSSNDWIDFSNNVLQIDSVEINDAAKRQGYGFYLYFALAKAGFAVISDNSQYIGGKVLWKKIAQNALSKPYNVYVIRDGKVVMATDDKPLVYDGSNIDDAELWSTDASQHYTLFALKTK